MPQVDASGRRDPSAPDEPQGVMFLYWGRRGALSQFALEAGRSAVIEPSIRAAISVSRQNELFGAFAEFGGALLAVDTFARGHGAITQAWRIPILRRQLWQRLRADRIRAVIDLMPHVWSPFVMPVVHDAGARYVTVVHDADPHPGDPTQWAKPITDLAMRQADAVVTLSASVAGKLVAGGRVPAGKVHTLFHPDLGYTHASGREGPVNGRPWRLLFLGRIMPYKGLPLCIEMVELLRSEGIAVELGVFGEGPLGASAQRLEGLGAEVVNRWLGAKEIGAALQRYDAAVLSYVEASQSGVAAAAFGAGMPVIATPVGGLGEQVQDNVTGVVAAAVDARALAEAAKRLFALPCHAAICGNIRQGSADRSMARFVRDIASVGLGRHDGP